MIYYSDLLSCPYVDKGRDPQKGLDCYGLVIEIYKRFGFELPEYTDQYKSGHDPSIGRAIKENSESDFIRLLNFPWPVPCILTFNLGVPHNISNHVGVYLGGDKFIHIRERAGLGVASIHSVIWRHLITGAFIYKGQKYDKHSVCV